MNNQEAGLEIAKEILEKGVEELARAICERLEKGANTIPKEAAQLVKEMGGGTGHAYLGWGRSPITVLAGFHHDGSIELSLCYPSNTPFWRTTLRPVE